MADLSQPFSADQLKLLIHFEAAESLLELSLRLHKDQSVKVDKADYKIVFFNELPLNLE